MGADLGGPFLDLVALDRVGLQKQEEEQLDKSSQADQQLPGLDIQVLGSPPLVGLLGNQCLELHPGVELGKLQLLAGNLQEEGTHYHHWRLPGNQSWQVQGSHHHLLQGSRCSGYY